jgi:hypothetical protein
MQQNHFKTNILGSMGSAAASRALGQNWGYPAAAPVSASQQVALRPRPSNFNNFGLGSIDLGSKIQKLQELLVKNNVKLPSPSTFASTPTTPTYGDYGDNSVSIYTRQELDDLIKGNYKRGRGGHSESGNADYFDQLLFVFQLYIAFINTLMNAASMGASFMFGNQALKNIFSVFLENVLSMILKTNVGDLTPEQLRDLLEKNKPILQQVSAILIDEVSKLLVGLSDVCSKLAMDWVQRILPGLLKSAAIGIPSAIEAAIPPLGEVVEIVNTGLALMGSFMKIIGAVQRNFDTASEGYSHVKNAYAGLQKVKDLLSQSPEDILKSATTAVMTPVVTAVAKNALDRAQSPNPFFSQSPSPSPSPSPQKQEQQPQPQKQEQQQEQQEQQQSPPSESMIRNLANKIKEKFGFVKVIVKSIGINVTGLSDLAEKIRKNSRIAVFLAKRLGMTITGLQGSMLTRLADELENVAGQPEVRSVQRMKSVGKNIVRPVANGLKKLSKHLDDISGGSSGSSGSRKIKMKSRKYSKNPNQFNKYISNLRKKTAKKELLLLNSIQEIKGI